MVTEGFREFHFRLRTQFRAKDYFFLSGVIRLRATIRQYHPQGMDADANAYGLAGDKLLEVAGSLKVNRNG